MKKLAIIIATLFSVTAFSQNGGASVSEKQKPETQAIPGFPDSVASMSARHIQQSFKNLTEKLKPLEDKLTVSQYNKLLEGIQAAYEELIAVATEDYSKKKKTEKGTK